MGTIAVFDRATPLPGVVGRVDYISNPDRQEHLEAFASTVDDPLFWKRLAKDSQTAWKQSGGNREGTSCCEAREVQFSLPNSARDRDLNKLAQQVVLNFKKKHGVDCCAAVHWNAAENNLHIHLIYSERQLLSEPVIRKAERNAFIDENGIRKRTKKEILDENGELRRGCKIVPKGEVLSERYFGDKNREFGTKIWLKNHKQEIADWINSELNPDLKRVVFDPNGPFLPQMHVGKGRPKEQQERVEEYNRQVKAFNYMVSEGIISEEHGYRIKTYVNLSPNKSQALAGLLCGIKLNSLNDPEVQNALKDTMIGMHVTESFLNEARKKFSGGKRTMYDEHDVEERGKQQLRTVIAEIATAESYEDWEEAYLKYSAMREEADRKAKELAEIRRRAKEEEEAYRISKNNEFYHARFRSSYNNKHYTTYLFDKNGRKRSLLELMFLLAVTVIKKEAGLWEPPVTEADKNWKLVIKTDWKIQRMVDSIRWADEEGVHTPDEIEIKLKQAGSAFSRAKAVHKRTSAAKAKIEPVNKAVKAYIAGDEEAKISLQGYGITTDEQIADFETRYAKISADLVAHKEKLDATKQRYSKLKRLQETTLMAQYEQYCYGPMYQPDLKPSLDRTMSVAAADEWKKGTGEGQDKRYIEKERS